MLAVTAAVWPELSRAGSLMSCAHPASRVHGVVGAVDGVEDDHELVAGEAADEIGARARCRAGGGR